jgi:hypothetical protein
MNRYEPRHLIVIGALIVLPLLMLGVAPLLQFLIPRIAALRGQVENFNGESQMVKEQVETLEAVSLESAAQVATVETELGTYDLQVFDARIVGIGQSIDASLQGGVTIYLEEPAVAAELIFDSADLGLNFPLAVPLAVAPAEGGP